MKRILLTFIAAIVCSSPLGVAQQPNAVGTPVVGGYSEGMKVDKNGLVRPLDTSKVITFPTGIAVVAENLGLEREFYIANRTNTPTTACVQNVCGTGTKLDPFDGSSRVKFEAVWAYVATQSPRQFILQPSTTPYLTNGGLVPMSNCVISGFGATIKGDTTMAVSGSLRFLIGDDYTDPLIAYTGCTIQGIKFDNNISNQATTTNISVGAIFFYGSYNRVIYNKFVGWGQTSSSGLENMVVGAGMSFATVPAVGNEIAYNEVTQEVAPIANGTSANTLISCSLNGTTAETSPSAKWNYNAWIHDNFIHDIPSQSGPMNLIGVGAWSVGQKIENNTFLNIPFNINGGIYSDTGLSLNARIAGNHFYNCNVGIILRGSGTSNRGLVIEYNEFFLTVVNPSYGIELSALSSVDLTVRNNIINRWNASGTNASGFYVANVTNGQIEGNKVGNTDHNRFQDNTNLVVRNNTFDIFEDFGGNTNLKTANNHKNDGTRLELDTDTDAYQDMKAFTAQLLQGNLISGNGSLVTQVQAQNIVTQARVVNDADFSITTNDYEITVNTLTHPITATLPSAASNAGKYKYIKDLSGNAGTHAITFSPNVEGSAKTINTAYGKIAFESNGTIWFVH